MSSAFLLSDTFYGILCFLVCIGCYILHEKCIARKSHYYKLSRFQSRTSLTSTGGTSSSGADGGVDIGDFEDVEMAPGNAQTTEDIMNLTTYDSRPAFGRLRYTSSSSGGMDGRTYWTERL